MLNKPQASWASQPIDLSFEVPKKVAVILVHKGAAKLPTLKHFLHLKKAFYFLISIASKLENLLQRMLFLSVKNL